MQLLNTSTRKRLSGMALSAAVLVVVSCGGKDLKKTAQPAPQAVAPVIQQPQAATGSSSPVIQSQPGQAPQAQAEPQKQDPVAATVAEAEKAYTKGLEEYNAGHLDVAKQNFNHAVDVLLQGPVDVKSDDRLQNEFDKITEEINKLEMEAFKQGDGFTEENSEPAPIDEANSVTFPVDPNVKAKAEADLPLIQSDLPLIMNDYVASYINYFSTRGKATFESALARSGKYREMIERVFKQEGVPQDLIYLAQAESGFKPLALSRARARGMWQFMASRGDGYGLHRSWWVDDRQDPEKATRAAARHLKDLYNEFGDWYLAMAAYNSGPGNVQQAVRRTGYADFWELYKRNVLPAETKNYVPIILAMIIMSKNPARYGLDDLKLDTPVTYDVVRVDYPVDLRLVAECVDVPVDELVDLNPSLLRRITPTNQPFDLHLPAGTKDKYETAIAAIPVDKRVAWRYHKVESGETLAGVARKYHTTERAIEQVNNLQGKELLADSKLVIPVSAQESRMVYLGRSVRYRVHPGDTLFGIARRFGVSAEQLRGWNRLKGNALRAGRLLVVHEAVGAGEVRRVSYHPHKKAVHHGKKRTAKTQKKSSASESVAVNTR